MPVFATPEPVSVTIGLAVGDVWISANDRADTLVEVRPSNPGYGADVRSAKETRVEYCGGVLLIEGPAAAASPGERGSIDVSVELPEGSAVRGGAAVANFRVAGRLGDCGLTTATGHIGLDRTGPLTVGTAAGDVTVEHVDGDAKVVTGSGLVSIGVVTGPVEVTNANGATKIGTAGGGLRVGSANGDITIGGAAAGVDAMTANGVVVFDGRVRGTRVCVP